MAQVMQQRHGGNGYRREREPYTLKAFPPEPPSSSTEQSAAAAAKSTTMQSGSSHQTGPSHHRDVVSTSSSRTADSTVTSGRKRNGDAQSLPSNQSDGAHKRRYKDHQKDKDAETHTSDDEGSSNERKRSSSSSSSSKNSEADSDTDQPTERRQGLMSERDDDFSDSSSQGDGSEGDTYEESGRRKDTSAEEKARGNQLFSSSSLPRDEIPRQHKQQMEKLAIENEMLRVQCTNLLQKLVSKETPLKSRKNDKIDGLLSEDKDADREGLSDDVDVKLERGPLGIHFAQAPPESAYALEVAQIPQMTKDGCISFVGNDWAKSSNSSLGDNLHPNTLALKDVQVGMVLVSLGGRDLHGLPAQRVNELLDETPRPLLLRFRMFPYLKLRKKYMGLRSQLSSMKIQASNLEESMRVSIEKSRKREHQKEREKEVLSQRLQELSKAYHRLYCKYSDLKGQQQRNEELVKQYEELQQELKKAQQSNVNSKAAQPADNSTGRMRGASVYIPSLMDGENQYTCSIAAEQALEERDCSIKALREARHDAELLESRLAAMQREYNKDKSKYQTIKEDLQKLISRLNGEGNQSGDEEGNNRSSDFLNQRIIPACEKYFSQKQNQLRRLEADNGELEQRKAMLHLQLEKICDMSHDYSKNRPPPPKRREASSSGRFNHEVNDVREFTLKPMPQADSSPGQEESHEHENESSQQNASEKKDEEQAQSENIQEQPESESIFKRVADDPEEALRVARESFEDSNGTVLESWLLKKSKKKSDKYGGKWKRRYVSLFSGYVWYHALPGDSSAKGSFCVKDILRVYKQKSTKGYEFVIEEKNKSYLFRAETEEVCDGWVSVIDEIISLCTKYSSIGNQEEAGAGFEGDSDLSD